MFDRQLHFLQLRGRNLHSSFREKIQLQQKNARKYAEITDQLLIPTSNLLTIRKKFLQTVKVAPEKQVTFEKQCEELTDTTDPKSSLQNKKNYVIHKSLHFRTNTSQKLTKKCTCGDCDNCIKDFKYFLNLAGDLNQKIPEITAKSWCIWGKKDRNHIEHFYGKRTHKIRQIASLTKIITGMAAVDFLNSHQLDPQKIFCKVKASAIAIGGTSANLKLNEEYNLLDLLYGMLLPSGNDAAITISQTIGLLFFLKTIKNKNINPYSQNWYQKYQSKNFALYFINLMRQKCNKLAAIDTKIYNSHGNDAYEQMQNLSTCHDIARLSCEFMKYPLLRNVVKTQKYKDWENTNKLLEDGFQGIKTGITDSAGPCLAAYYCDVIVVVLNSKSKDQRWIQVKKLVKWFLKNSKKQNN